MDIFDAVLAAQIAKNGSGGGSVTSVNGQTGAVVLVATDVGAEPEKFVITLEDGEQPNTFVADKTEEEFFTAFTAGKLLLVKYGSDFYYYVGSPTGEGLAFVRSYISSVDNNAVIDAFYYNPLMHGWLYDYKLVPFASQNRTVTGSTPTIEPAANTIYNCGTLTSLTISNPPATGKYVIIFYSGATATTTIGIENFVAEANKRYKITVEDNYATYDSWPYTPT